MKKNNCIIKTNNISHSYESDIALDNINIDIKKGEFISIIGESGSGKSTLLSILSTLLQPTKGELFFNDINYKDIKNIDNFRQENIGFIFQFHYLINYLTVKQNIQLASPKTQEKDIVLLLEQLGISILLNKFPDQLSGGERQRVAIARALINKPSVIFADEPTGNLDSKNSLIVFELFRELSKNGTTIVVATHDTKLSNLSDKVYEVIDGKL